MTTEQFRDLPEPDDFPIVDAVTADAEVDEPLSGSADLLDLADEVSVDDLSTDQLIDNGALPEDLEPGNFGRNELHADLSDPAHEDTIEERIRQEEPDVGTEPASLEDPEEA